MHGDLDEGGVTVEWREFEDADATEWSRGFLPGTLGLCLNLAGRASIQFPDRQVDYEVLTGGFYRTGNGGLKAWRFAGRHRFVEVVFSRRFLQEQLGGEDGALHPLVQGFVRGDDGPGGGEVRPLTAEQERLTAQLVEPPVFQGARRLWYQSKVLQLMADFFFERPRGEELFCDRQKRLARQRVERVIAVLRQHLAEPPSLEGIGRAVGCSPFHLSRTFSRETGLTIPQYLRKLRMERAAELLRSGRCNVTEAAMEVGYSSLSHFSQAFCQTMGCCPGLYPLGVSARPSGR